MPKNWKLEKAKFAEHCLNIGIFDPFFYAWSIFNDLAFDHYFPRSKFYFTMGDISRLEQGAARERLRFIKRVV